MGSQISDVSRSPASGRCPPPAWRSDVGNASGMVFGAVIAPAAYLAVLPGACYDVTMHPATRPAAPASANVSVAPRSACLDDCKTVEIGDGISVPYDPHERCPLGMNLFRTLRASFNPQPARKLAAPSQEPPTGTCDRGRQWLGARVPSSRTQLAYPARVPKGYHTRGRGASVPAPRRRGMTNGLLDVRRMSDVTVSPHPAGSRAPPPRGRSGASDPGRG